MSLNVTQPEINLREKFVENKQRLGIKGKEILESDTVEEARNTFSAGRKNIVINGGFDIWQRGTVFDVYIGYSADRWYSWNNAKIERTLTDDDRLVSKYAMKVTKDNAFATSPYSVNTHIERFRNFIDDDFTLSYWIRSNKRTSSGTPIMYVSSNAGSVGNTTISVGRIDAKELFATPEWVKKTVSFHIPDYTVAEIDEDAFLNLYITPSLDTSSHALQENDWIELADVQLERGTNATEFERRSVGSELALCERYFQKSYDYDVDPGSISNNGMLIEFGSGTGRNNSTLTTGAVFKRPMLTAPTIRLYSSVSGAVGVIWNSSDKVSTALYIGKNKFGRITINGGSTSSHAAFHYTATAELA